MRIKSLVAAAVIMTFGTGLVPAPVFAGERQAGATTAHVDFEKAITRAVEQSSRVPSGAVVRLNGSAQPAMQRGYGGGGGHVMMVMSIVGMVAGIGMTYYMVKQMQKTTGDVTQTATTPAK